ncbi:uncharacterized protein LOC105227783 isoform X2 [Bactrocera dorsalis]|uniref:Uncharacterized protein LOC105227783 isoform X2 n=1 Tax=Bactrocera dorsalis TaxID=27457 RepID=A0ABM3JJW7_BACDO|nr:uncharacterized protein LOC105227783 isoform X2 [Bactrocera dorsalis]
MKVTLVLIAVLLVLQNRSISANLSASEIVSNLFDATFNSTGFSVEVVISEPFSAREACANELNDSIRKDIADAGADIRQALRIQQTVAQENCENLNRLKKELVANINKCVEQNANHFCHFSAIQHTIREIQALSHNHIPVDNAQIFLRLVELCRSLDKEFAKYEVCLLEHPEVTSLKPQASSEPPGYSLSTESEPTASSLTTEKGSSDSSETEETTAKPSSDSSETEETTANPSSDSSETEETTANSSSDSSETEETTANSSSDSSETEETTAGTSSDSSETEETTAGTSSDS